MLRFVKSGSGDISQTKAEMDWLLYLANKGVSVPSPLKARDGTLAVSAIENGETYVISALRMMEGQHWNKNDSNLWSIDVFRNWGKVVGDMHCVSKDYKPANDTDKRGAFNLQFMISDRIKNFPSVGRIAENLICEISTLTKDKDSYGLIHNDLHPNNFLINGECINLYDFDDCAYFWYMFDIGNALYLSLWLGRTNNAGVDFTNDIIKHFLKGYLSVNHVNDFWLSKIPLFMMLCKIALFSWGSDSENPDKKLNDEQQEEQMRNIENNILFTGYSIDDSLFENE